MAYRQYKLGFENAEQVAWLPRADLAIGTRVELKEDGYFWEVKEVYNGILSDEAFKEHQQLNRGSLSSIK